MTLDRKQVAEALPNYEIGDELGRGGWGVVLSGRHRQLDRDVAIKQLPRAFSADDAVRSRFVIEAKVLASLDHPHIVPVYDYVEKDGLCLLVMEQLPGGTVWTRFSDTGFTSAAACAVVLACSAGLQAAHDRNILHRDIKPENLMFSASGALKVTDFGIAKVVGGNETMATRAGEVVGTPAYIAPEQARGGTLSPSTDVYALATMLYELLSGELPFADDGDAMALMFKHAYEEPVPLSDKVATVPEPVAAVVMKGLATDPAERYPSAQSFGLALAEACTVAWDPGWLAAEHVPVMGASELVSATERVTAPVVSAPPAPAAPATVQRGHAPAPPTVARAEGAVSTVGQTAPSPTDLPKPPTIVRPVRPSVTLRPRGGAVLDDIGEADLVPLMVKAPPGPLLPMVIAAALFVAAVVVALIGLGSPSTGGSLPRHIVTVAGVDPTAGAVVHLNTAKPIAVDVGPGAPSADRARLTLSVLGVDFSQSSAPLTPSGYAKVASITDSGARYLVAGRVTAELELLNGNAVTGDWRFAARTTQSGLLSLAGGIFVILVLFAGAYFESHFRVLRRGRRKVSSAVGIAIMGALLAVGAAGVISLAVGHELTVVTLVVCAVLGAGAGTSSAYGGLRIGRRRRVHRAQRKEPAA
jgi:hypothetical protein